MLILVFDRPFFSHYICLLKFFLKKLIKLFISFLMLRHILFIDFNNLAKIRKTIAKPIFC